MPIWVTTDVVDDYRSARSTFGDAMKDRGAVRSMQCEARTDSGDPISDFEEQFKSWLSWIRLGDCKSENTLKRCDSRTGKLVGRMMSSCQ
jgi:hypothetical protein